MFGIQTSELIVIALIAILLFGPEKVPEFFHRAGQMMSKVQRSADDLWTSLQIEMNQAKKPLEELGEEMKSIGSSLQSGLEGGPSPSSSTAPDEETPEGDSEGDVEDAADDSDT